MFFFSLSAFCSFSKHELQEESRNMEEEPEAAGTALAFYWDFIPERFIVTEQVDKASVSAVHCEPKN